MYRWMDKARAGRFNAAEADEFALAVRECGSVAGAKRLEYGHAGARHIEAEMKTDSYLHVKVHDALADWHRARADEKRTEAGL